MLQRLFAWWTKKNPRDLLLETIADARRFEEWEAAAYHLDELLGYDLWRQNATSKYYNYRLIHQRLTAIIEAHEDDDMLGLIGLLRSGLVRNLGNITAPRLFDRAYGGTKLLIEDYVTQVAYAIEYLTQYPTAASSDTGLTNQAKLDVLHDTRQAFGRSVLVLQGGQVFGICHLGVIKALHLRGLLPRIIAGTATGAIIAALVGVHTEDELLDFLNGKNIDLTAFAKRPTGKGSKGSGWFETLSRRIRRWWQEGHFLDVGVLEQLLRANVGDLTFEEAYTRTKRVLNITVTTSGGGGVPNLLNYLTAPNVVSTTLNSQAVMLRHSAYLVRCSRFQRDRLFYALQPRRADVQRRLRRHRTLGTGHRDHLPSMDPRLLHRPTIASAPHRRTLQRKPLHRLPSTALPCALPTLRPPPPKSATRRTLETQHAYPAPRSAGSTTPTSPT